MAARRIIEEEAGIWTGRRHRHDGYCAGDFSNTPFPTARTARHLEPDTTDRAGTAGGPAQDRTAVA